MSHTQAIRRSQADASLSQEIISLPKKPCNDRHMVAGIQSCLLLDKPYEVAYTLANSICPYVVLVSFLLRTIERSMFEQPPDD